MIIINGFEVIFDNDEIIVRSLDGQQEIIFASWDEAIEYLLA